MLRQQNADMVRGNEIQMLGSPRSKKNLQNQQMIQSPHNYQVQTGLP